MVLTGKYFLGVKTAAFGIMIPRAFFVGKTPSKYGQSKYSLRRSIRLFDSFFYNKKRSMIGSKKRGVFSNDRSNRGMTGEFFV